MADGERRRAQLLPANGETGPEAGRSSDGCGSRPTAPPPTSSPAPTPSWPRPVSAAKASTSARTPGPAAASASTPGCSTAGRHHQPELPPRRSRRQGQVVPGQVAGHPLHRLRPARLRPRRPQGRMERRRARRRRRGHPARRRQRATGSTPSTPAPATPPSTDPQWDPRWSPDAANPARLAGCSPRSGDRSPPSSTPPSTSRSPTPPVATRAHAAAGRRRTPRTRAPICPARPAAELAARRARARARPSSARQPATSAGLFDGPSTVTFDPSLPMVSLDLSRDPRLRPAGRDGDDLRLRLDGSRPHPRRRRPTLGHLRRSLASDAPARAAGPDAVPVETVPRAGHRQPPHRASALRPRRRRRQRAQKPAPWLAASSETAPPRSSTSRRSAKPRTPRASSASPQQSARNSLTCNKAKASGEWPTAPSSSATRPPPARSPSSTPTIE